MATQPLGTGGADAAGGSATGGSSVAGGGEAATGGASQAGQSDTGGNASQGGSQSTGGAVSTGGAAVISTGGAAPTGGALSTGGAFTGTTGGATPTGGSVATGGFMFGGFANTGGQVSTGGNAATTGGAAPAGGSDATGGSIAATGGSSTNNSDAATTISDWLNNKSCIAYGNPSGQTRTDIIDAIIGACEQFGPPPESNPGWKMEYCWSHMTGSILKESSYNVTSVMEPGSDPTVGLTQIRFSSTVCDFYTGGPRARLEAMGCTFPADFADHASEQCSSTFWKSTGGDAAHTQWMQIPACNIGLGAWYYYTYATGGGDTAATQYLYQLCNGKAQDANLATGLMSHLRGPSNQWASIQSMSAVPSAGTDYFNAISKVMDCELGGSTGTNAIFTKLTFNKSQYCK